MKDKKLNYKEFYQAALNGCYKQMDELVKAGKLQAGWQKDKEAVKKLKEAAKLFAKTEMKKQREGNHGEPRKEKISNKKNGPGKAAEPAGQK